MALGLQIQQGVLHDSLRAVSECCMFSYLQNCKTASWRHIGMVCAHLRSWQRAG